MQNRIFGIMDNGENVYLIKLFLNELSVNILTFGAILQNMHFKQRSVVLGYNELQPYIKNDFIMAL